MLLKKISRRGFFGTAGAAAVAAPSVAKAATIGDLNSPVASVGHGPMFPDDVLAETSRLQRATNGLKKLAGLSRHDKEREIREYHIEAFDADTHALRSMSIGAKYRRSQRVLYERSLLRRKSYFERLLDGDDY